MKSVKIYEMLMRDGFQSLDKIYNLETKKEVIKLLIECNNNNIEFGSTTSKKLLPQLGDTFELWEYIKELNMNKNIDNYTILNTSKRGLERSIECGIKSHSLICSISDKFSLLIRLILDLFSRSRSKYPGNATISFKILSSLKELNELVLDC